MSDLALATHAESSFDPDLYVSLFYSGKYHNEKDVNISAWLQDRCHDTFKDGMYLFCAENMILISVS